MLTVSRLDHLEEVHRRHLEGLPNDIEEEMVIDLLTMLKDMVLRNEVLRGENESLRQNLSSDKKN